MGSTNVSTKQGPKGVRTNQSTGGRSKCENTNIRYLDPLPSSNLPFKANGIIWSNFLGFLMGSFVKMLSVLFL